MSGIFAEGQQYEREAVVAYLQKRVAYFLGAAKATDDEEKRGAFFFAYTVLQNEIEKISAGEHQCPNIDLC